MWEPLASAGNGLYLALGSCYIDGVHMKKIHQVVLLRFRYFNMFKLYLNFSKAKVLR